MFNKKIIVLFFFVIYFLMPILCNSNIQFKLEGLDDQLDDNARKQLFDSIVGIECVNIMDCQKRLDSLLREGMRALGFYSPDIAFFLNCKIVYENNLIL